MTAPRNEITQLLLEWRGGDAAALDKLVPLVYDELRRIAKRHMAAERSGHTLQTTALIHEAYLRLIDYKDMPWQDRAHFFAVAAQAMRRVLVDHARNRGAAKRGGGAAKATLEEMSQMAGEQEAELVALDDALRNLVDIDPRKGRVVELRYFGGLTVAETAEVLGISPVTVMRDWSTAKAWLLRAITEGRSI